VSTGAFVNSQSNFRHAARKNITVNLVYRKRTKRKLFMLQSLPLHTEILHVSLFKGSNCIHAYVKNWSFRGTLY